MNISIVGIASLCGLQLTTYAPPISGDNTIVELKSIPVSDSLSGSQLTVTTDLEIPKLID